MDADYLGRFCGQDTPRLISKLPGLCLLFRTDPALHGRGWLLSYRAAPPPSSNGCKCGGGGGARGVECWGRVVWGGGVECWVCEVWGGGVECWVCVRGWRCGVLGV